MPSWVWIPGAEKVIMSDSNRPKKYTKWSNLHLGQYEPSSPSRRELYGSTYLLHNNDFSCSCRDCYISSETASSPRRWVSIFLSQLFHLRKSFREGCFVISDNDQRLGLVSKSIVKTCVFLKSIKHNSLLTEMSDKLRERPSLQESLTPIVLLSTERGLSHFCIGHFWAEVRLIKLYFCSFFKKWVNLGIFVYFRSFPTQTLQKKL